MVYGMFHIVPHHAKLQRQSQKGRDIFAQLLGRLDNHRLHSDVVIISETAATAVIIHC